MPRTATVGKPGTPLPKPTSLPQGSHLTINPGGGKTMTTGSRGGRRTRRRRTHRRR